MNGREKLPLFKLFDDCFDRAIKQTTPFARPTVQNHWCDSLARRNPGTTIKHIRANPGSVATAAGGKTVSRSLAVVRYSALAPYPFDRRRQDRTRSVASAALEQPCGAGGFYSRVSIGCQRRLRGATRAFRVPLTPIFSAFAAHQHV